ncbi:MAG: hypothetical protein ABUL62_07000 [Myxococcales bacterium]
MSSYDGSEKCLPASVALRVGNRATRHQRFVSTLVVAFVGLLSPEPAHAEDSASDRATARALAGEGYAALKKKDYATAEDRFLRADQLVHAPTLVLDHGRALVGLGRIGEAYAAFDSIVREVVPPNAPAVWKRAVKDAQRELESLKPQVAWLTLTVEGPAEPVVEVDGRPLPAERLGEKLPETPGSRHIAVSAPGFITQELEEPLKAGEERQLDVDLQPVPEPPPVIVHAPAPKVASTASAAQDRGTGRRTLTYVSFGVAGVGLAVGTATGILWLKARSDIKSACGGLSCAAQNDAEQSRYDDDKRRYDTFGTLSGVGFGVGLVGAASGVLLLLTQPTDSVDGEMKQAGVHPYVGPGMLGVYGAFQ